MIKTIGIIVISVLIIWGAIGVFGYVGGFLRDMYVSATSSFKGNQSSTNPGSNIINTGNPVSGELSLKEVRDQVYAKGNELRQSNGGRVGLSWDGRLASLAQQHSDDMVKRNYFNLNTPEGLEPHQQMDQVSQYHWGCVTFERMFISKVKITNSGNVDIATFDSWVQGYINENSESILSKNTATGIGITPSSNGQAFLTQIVCTI